MTACTRKVKPGSGRKNREYRSRSESQPSEKLKSAHFSQDRKVVVDEVPGRVVSTPHRGRNGVKCGKETR